MSTLNFQDVIKRFEASEAAANAANEERYQELMTLLQGLVSQTGSTYQDVLNDLSTSGDSAKQRVQQNAVRLWGQSEQDLISRGLGNTTIRMGARRGIEEDTQRLMNEIDEQVSRQKAGVKQSQASANIQTTGMLASAIEGRNDVGPDMSQYAALLQNAAAAGTGEPLSAVVSRSPSGGGGVSFGSRGSGGGNRFGSSGGGNGGPAETARVVGPGVGQDYDLAPKIEGLSGLAAAQVGADPNPGSSKQQTQQRALGILRTTAGGMVPNASHIAFEKEFGMSPKAWVRQNS